MRVELMDKVGSGWRRRPTMVADDDVDVVVAGVSLEDAIDVGGGGALLFEAAATPT